nr:MAG TPA: hypothetical protein [Caudoviricetes sp.]
MLHFSLILFGNSVFSYYICVTKGVERTTPR